MSLEKYYAWADAEFARRTAEKWPGYNRQQVAPKLSNRANSIRKRIAAKEREMSEQE